MKAEIDRMLYIREDSMIGGEGNSQKAMWRLPTAGHKKVSIYFKENHGAFIEWTLDTSSAPIWSSNSGGRHITCIAKVMAALTACIAKVMAINQ